jgi:hypothetical protein
LGSFGRRRAISNCFGYDRGTPIDRYYIERFLDDHAPDITGRVLEIGDATYTRRFGGSRVAKSDILHVDPAATTATISGDLVSGRGVPHGCFDCVILTQTLHLLYDIRSALATVERALAPGGVLLATVPGITRISRPEMDRWGDCWRFTSYSARRVVEEAFGGEVEIAAYGNVLTAVSFLHGLAAEELRAADLDEFDRDFEVTIGIRARKASPGP